MTSSCGLTGCYINGPHQHGASSTGTPKPSSNQGPQGTSMPEWITRHLSSDDHENCGECLALEAFSIAWEALEEIRGSYVYDGRKVEDAMRRIEELGK